MIRRTFARKSLIATLALVMGLAPTVSSAAAATPMLAPIQFKNWTSETLYNVTITHTYGIGCKTQTFNIGTVAAGQTQIGGWVTYYTSGSNAGDFWTVTAHFGGDDYDQYMVYRSLDRYDLTAVDKAVFFTVIISTEGTNTGLGCGQALSYFSNNGCKTDLPMAFYD